MGHGRKDEVVGVRIVGQPAYPEHSPSFWISSLPSTRPGQRLDVTRNLLLIFDELLGQDLAGRLTHQIAAVVDQSEREPLVPDLATPGRFEVFRSLVLS